MNIELLCKSFILSLTLLYHLLTLFNLLEQNNYIKFQNILCFKIFSLFIEQNSVILKDFLFTNTVIIAVYENVRRTMNLCKIYISHISSLNITWIYVKTDLSMNSISYHIWISFVNMSCLIPAQQSYYGKFKSVQPIEYEDTCRIYKKTDIT